MNKIMDLIQDALQQEDYRSRINFLVAGLMAEESNDTPEKFEASKRCLSDLLDYIQDVSESSEKKEYLLHLANTIREYLNNVSFMAEE